MRKRIAVACVALAGCSLLFDLDRFDKGSATPTDAGSDRTLADVATGDDGDDGSTAPGDDSGTGGDTGTDANVCHPETEPNEDTTHHSTVLPGGNCGAISTPGDIDVWEWDQVGTGSLTMQASSSLHYDISGPGTNSMNNGTNQTKGVDTGHWQIMIFSQTGQTATYTLTLQ